MAARGLLHLRHVPAMVSDEFGPSSSLVRVPTVMANSKPHWLAIKHALTPAGALRIKAAEEPKPKTTKANKKGNNEENNSEPPAAKVDDTNKPNAYMGEAADEETNSSV